MTTTGTPAFAFSGAIDDPDGGPPDTGAPETGLPPHARRLLVLTAVMIGLSFLPGPWSIAALPLALVVPGYGVCGALVGPRRPHGIGVRFVLWVAVSVAALILTGVVAGAIGFQLDRTRILLGQAGLALIAAGVTVLRRASIDGAGDGADTAGANDDPPAPADHPVDLTEQPDDPRQTRIAVGFLLATIAIAAIGITLVQRTDDGTARIMYVSMGFDGVVPGAPLTTEPDGTATVTVVIENHDITARDLSLRAGVDGGGAWSGGEVRTIGPASRSTVRLSGPVPASGCYQRISIALMDGDRAVTRLSRWVAGDPALPCAAPATTG